LGKIWAIFYQVYLDAGRKLRISIFKLFVQLLLGIQFSTHKIIYHLANFCKIFFNSTYTQVNTVICFEFINELVRKNLLKLNLAARQTFFLPKALKTAFHNVKLCRLLPLPQIVTFYVNDSYAKNEHVSHKEFYKINNIVFNSLT
jgi:hypothetical protein